MSDRLAVNDMRPARNEGEWIPVPTSVEADCAPMQFALTYNGYDVLGDLQAVAAGTRAVARPPSILCSSRYFTRSVK